jgi:hypothetical protein
MRKVSGHRHVRAGIDSKQQCLLLVGVMDPTAVPNLAEDPMREPGTRLTTDQPCDGEESVPTLADPFPEEDPLPWGLSSPSSVGWSDHLVHGHTQPGRGFIDPGTENCWRMLRIGVLTGLKYVRSVTA